jgi:hypothetical protein
MNIKSCIQQRMKGWASLHPQLLYLLVRIQNLVPDLKKHLKCGISLACCDEHALNIITPTGSEVFCSNLGILLQCIHLADFLLEHRPKGRIDRSWPATWQLQPLHSLESWRLQRLSANKSKWFSHMTGFSRDPPSSFGAILYIDVTASKAVKFASATLERSMETSTGIEP